MVMAYDTDCRTSSVSNATARLNVTKKLSRSSKIDRHSCCGTAREPPISAASSHRVSELHLQVSEDRARPIASNNFAEAPLNGYAFGKGVYLADCSSKSANYCMASMTGGTGLLLLVESEMSRPMYEIDTGDSNAEEAAKQHNCIATKGIGAEVPLKFKDAGCIHDDLKGVLMVSFSTLQYC